MYITFTISHRGKRYDLQADDNQTIRHLLAIVAGNMDVDFSAARIDYAKTFRRPDTVSADTTLAMAGVHSGDILYLIDEQEELGA